MKSSYWSLDLLLENHQGEEVEDDYPDERGQEPVPDCLVKRSSFDRSEFGTTQLIGKRRRNQKFTFRISEIPVSDYDRSHGLYREGLRQKIDKLVEHRRHAFRWPDDATRDKRRVEHADCKHDGRLFSIGDCRDQHSKAHATNTW